MNFLALKKNTNIGCGSTRKLQLARRTKFVIVCPRYRIPVAFRIELWKRSPNKILFFSVKVYERRGSKPSIISVLLSFVFMGGW